MTDEQIRKLALARTGRFSIGDAAKPLPGADPDNLSSVIHSPTPALSIASSAIGYCYGFDYSMPPLTL